MGFWRFAIVTVLLALFSIGLGASPGLGVSLDLAALQDVVTGSGGVQFDSDFRFDVVDRFQMRLPLCVTVFKPDVMYETGVYLVYYPWETGPYVGFSLIQLGFVTGNSSIDSLISLNEVVLGWTFEFAEHFYIEPSVVVRDPSGTFSTEYSSLKGVFPCYTTFRARLAVGWKAFVFREDAKE